MSRKMKPATIRSMPTEIVDWTREVLTRPSPTIKALNDLDDLWSLIHKKTSHKVYDAMVSNFAAKTGFNHGWTRSYVLQSQKTGRAGLGMFMMCVLHIIQARSPQHDPWAEATPDVKVFKHYVLKKKGGLHAVLDRVVKPTSFYPEEAPF